MWFGTDQGAARFDGVNFEYFNLSNALCDNNITGFFQDSKARVWFLTESDCLSYYLDGKVHQLELDLDEYINGNFGTYFCTENADQLFFSGKGNVVLILDLDLKTSEIRTIGLNVSDFLYPIKTQKNAVEFTTQSSDWPVDFINDSILVKSIVKNSKGDLVKLTSKGIILENDTLISVSDLSNLRAIDKIYMDDEDHIYTISQLKSDITLEGKENPTAHFIKTSAGYAKADLSLENNSYSDVYRDRHGSLWFSTYNSGVYFLPASQANLIHYERYKGASSTCLSLGEYGNVYIGSSGNSVIRFNQEKREQELQIGPPTGSSLITEIMIDEQNTNFWCGGDFGLLKLDFERDSNSIKSMLFSGLSFVPVSQVHDLIDETDSTLLCATDFGIRRINKISNSSPEIGEFSTTKSAKTLLIDRMDRLWFDQGGKLYFKDKQELKEFDSRGKSFGLGITDLELCIDGSIAVSTFGEGIHFIKHDSIFYTFNESNGLSSNTVYKLQAFDHALYAATNSGLLQCTWYGYRADPGFVFSKKYGLPSDVINDVILTDSLIYLATSAGLIILDSEDYKAISKSESKPPKLELNSFSSRDSVYNTDEEIRLNYSESFFKISYKAIVFDQASEVEYSYRFSENSPWQSTYSSSLEVPKFESGDYQFQLRSKRYNSDWSQPMIINFKALPPWWSTWWARIFYLSLLVGISFAIAKFYAKRKYEKQLAIIQKEQALLEERNRISADMHDDLGSDLSKIAILSQVARAKLNLPKEKEQPILDIDNAASDIIKKMNEIIWALNPTNDTLESLIIYLQKYVNDYLEMRNLSGRIIIPDHIPDFHVKAIFRRNTFLIIKEYLHNVHKHAQATRIDAEITISDDLVISMKENGVGFDMETTRRFGNGLNNIQKRAESINGNAIQNSAPGEGSSLVLTLPILKNHDFVLDKN